MTDWTKATGRDGTMMIRDTGTYVEFWLKANSSTYNHQLPWGWSVNGSSDTSNEFYFNTGGAYQRLGRWNVTYDQTVTFYLYDSGTNSLGGPTTFSHAITRATVPSAPGTPTISLLGNTSFAVTFSDGANNGSAIDSRQIGLADGTVTAPTLTQTYGGAGSLVLSRTPGAQYSVWGRTHNAKGYSAWSARTLVTMLNVPVAPAAPVLTNASMSRVHVKFTDNATGGSPILERRVGHGTNPAAPTYYTTGSDIDVIVDLTPGAMNYFWGQSRNEFGWSALSASSSIRLPAGSRINVGGVWLNAVPYVKDGGLWKPAEPYAKDLGVWMRPT